MITLYGLSDGRAGKAWCFLADNWREYEFLPASNAWFEPDLLAEEPGRGWMKIKPWLAKKNGWTEMEPAEPSEYARVKDAVRDRGLPEYRLHPKPPADYDTDEEVRAAWDRDNLGLPHGWRGAERMARAAFDLDQRMASHDAGVSGRSIEGDSA